MLRDAVPFWFGPSERPLFGWWHAPAGAARAGVVLCQSLGYEQHCAYRTYRVLAERLAAQGFAVLRFDYDGTGDSAGDYGDPGRFDAWVDSTRVAVDELRASGVGRVVLVGMRMGAAIAAAALGSRRTAADALVLWDPVTSGPRYVRELTVLHNVVVGQAALPDGRGDLEFEAAGAVFTDETVGALRAFDLGQLDGPLAPHILLLSRPERPASTELVEQLRHGALSSVDVGAALGQDLLVDVPIPHSQVPLATVDRIVDWVASQFDATGGRALDPLRTRRDRAVVAHTDDGRDIVEHARWLGAARLFSITTAVDGASGPIVVGLNSAIVHHIGQNRMWVQLARRWATHGVRFTRVDVSGIGDSAPRPGALEDDAHARGSIDDVAEVIAALTPESPSAVTLLGLCTGGYLGVNAAAALGVRSLCAINPNLNWNDADAMTSTTNGGADAAGTTRPLVHRVAGSRTGAALRDRLPPAAWYALDRARVHTSPARGLEQAVARGVRVLLVYGDRDEYLGGLRARGGFNLRRLQRDPKFRLQIVPNLDHAMLARATREQVFDLLSSHVVGLGAGGAIPVAPSVVDRT